MPGERLHHPDAAGLPVRGPGRARPGRERAREGQAAGGAAAGRGASEAGAGAGAQDQREDDGQRWGERRERRSPGVPQQTQQPAQHERSVRRRLQPLQRITDLLQL